MTRRLSSYLHSAGAFWFLAVFGGLSRGRSSKTQAPSSREIPSSGCPTVRRRPVVRPPRASLGVRRPDNGLLGISSTFKHQAPKFLIAPRPPANNPWPRGPGLGLKAWGFSGDGCWVLGIFLMLRASSGTCSTENSEEPKCLPAGQKETGTPKTRSSGARGRPTKQPGAFGVRRLVGAFSRRDKSPARETGTSHRNPNPRSNLARKSLS